MAGSGSRVASLVSDHGGANALTAGLQAVTKEWKTFVGELTGGIGQARNLVGQFVGAFNPASLELFDRAVNDLYGSIGEILTPVMAGLTEVVRFAADTVAGLTPVLQPLIRDVLGAARPVFEAMGGALRQALTAAAPVVELLGTTLTTLLTAAQPIYQAYYDILGSVAELVATGLQGSLEALMPVVPVVAAVLGLVADAARKVAVFIRGLADELRELLGLAPLQKIDFDDAGRGKGAPKGTSTTTVSAMLQQLQEKAFGSSANVMAEVAKNTGGMAAEIAELKVYFMSPRFPNDLKAALAGLSVRLMEEAKGQAAGEAVGWGVGVMNARAAIDVALDAGRRKLFGG
jgi:phage-related protein